MKGKTCLVYGDDGFDLCTLYSVLDFYKSLGFKVFFSNNVQPANLIVVVRTYNREMNCKNIAYDAIHIYDYVGSEFDKFLKTIDLEKLTIFCPSDERKKYLMDNYRLPNDIIKIALAPVSTTFYAKKLRPDSKYNIVHVGNHKPYYADGTDLWAERFLNFLNNEHVDMWGVGWKLKSNSKSVLHGKVNFFGVRNIYAASRVALGMMYPFQRDVSISCRFWEAPLNGCVLISEPSLYSKTFPGIIETDYSETSIKSIIQSLPNRTDVQKQAIEFWDRESSKTKELVLQSFGKINFTKSGLLKHPFAFFGNYVVNSIRKVFHRLR